MIFPCKDYPVGGEADWCPFLNVRIANPKRHSPPSMRFEAMIDTGASRCIFHAQIGESVGFDVRKGIEENTIGVSGLQTRLYVHEVAVYTVSGIIKIRAGFSYELPLAGLLGRRGFLSEFKFTLDPSTNPPQFELEKYARA
jgi:hypothetical protein